MSKITFITTHNWDTKRQGGFHIFARECALSGIETVFFSFPRPYYGIFMHREQLNKDIIALLKKGAEYKIEDSDKKILNVTYPTLRLPDSFGKFLPKGLMRFLAVTSLRPFKLFAKAFLSGTDCFVFESCEGIYLIDKIKRFFPKSKIIYRPSDPLVFASVPESLRIAEQRFLRQADLSIIVNKEGLDAYKKQTADFEQCVNFELLSNGVDIESYKKKYEAPDCLKNKRSVLYVGAWEVEWKLLFTAAEKTPELNYIVVCPNYPPLEIISEINRHKNLEYIPGIKPEDVPAWITNCSVVMVPYKTDFYKDRPLGITAKYYQAMAAKKPIVAYSDTPKLRDAGIPVCYEYDEFIKLIKEAANNPEIPEYNFNLKDRDWNSICRKFIEFTELKK